MHCIGDSNPDDSPRPTLNPWGGETGPTLNTAAPGSANADEWVSRNPEWRPFGPVHRLNDVRLSGGLTVPPPMPGARLG